MTTITLEGKEYLLDIKQAETLGLLKEKDSRVKSWEEFKRKHPNYFSHLTAQESKAFDAFSKLLKLRRDWIGEWESKWSTSENKYVIINWNNHLQIEYSQVLARPLSFPTEQMAKDFLETFRDLIEEAKILI